MTLKPTKGLGLATISAPNRPIHCGERPNQSQVKGFEKAGGIVISSYLVRLCYTRGCEWGGRWANLDEKRVAVGCGCRRSSLCCHFHARNAGGQ